MKTQILSSNLTLGLCQVNNALMALAIGMLLCLCSCDSVTEEISITTKGCQLTYQLHYELNGQESGGRYTMSFDNRQRLLSAHLGKSSSFFFTYDEGSAAAEATSIETCQSTSILLNDRNLPILIGHTVVRYDFGNNGLLQELTTIDTDHGRTTTLSFSYSQAPMPAQYQRIAYAPHLLSNWIEPVGAIMLSNLKVELMPTVCQVTCKDTHGEQHFTVTYQLNANGLAATIQQGDTSSGETSTKSPITDLLYTF